MQQTWENFYKAHNYFHLEPHEVLPAFADKCEAKKIDNILDLGCGAGTNILYLSERGFKVTGVDFSPAAASNAEDLLQSKDLTGKIYVDNLFDKVTTFSAEEFSGVIAINSLEYTDLSTFTTTIAEVARILSPNGIFLLAVSSKDTKPEVVVPPFEQLFFSEEQLTEIVCKRFSILDFMEDNNDSLVLILEKISRY